ncbi:hypothetical protein WA026_003728 [Henosepilachna vigintioctopunctata]|uniref:Uncharacterized protein n=1 Tax=Henosepilachna vigintioctopunctata TaxID=420089 RepID=A0AAW1UE52_9CUCU
MILTSRKKKTADSNRTLELNISIKKKLGSKLEGTIDFWKCDSQGSPASCEYVAKDLKIRRVCNIMLAKNQAWSLVVEGFKPPLRCPFEPQLYRTEYAVNDAVFKFFPVSTGVWKAKGFYTAMKERCLFVWTSMQEL